MARYRITLRCKKYSREAATHVLTSKMEQAYVHDPRRELTDEQRASSFRMWQEMYHNFAEFLFMMIDERDFKLVMNDVERWATRNGWPIWRRDRFEEFCKLVKESTPR